MVPPAVSNSHSPTAAPSERRMSCRRDIPAGLPLRISRRTSGCERLRLLRPREPPVPHDDPQINLE